MGHPIRSVARSNTACQRACRHLRSRFFEKGTKYEESWNNTQNRTELNPQSFLIPVYHVNTNQAQIVTAPRPHTTIVVAMGRMGWRCVALALGCAVARSSATLNSGGAPHPSNQHTCMFCWVNCPQFFELRHTNCLSTSARCAWMGV
jgi:hypothetical protein